MSKEINYITVTDSYRFGKCDEHNFVLEEYREVHAKPNRFLTEARTTQKWVEVGFYNNVADVLHSVVKRSGNAEAEKVDNIKAVLRKMQEVSENLMATFKGTSMTLDSFDKPTDGRGRKTAVAEAESVVAKPKKEKKPVKTATKKARKVAAKVKPVVKAKRGRPSKSK